MKERNRGGRPSKFTTTTALRLVSAIAQSDTIEQAAESADVGASTVYRWVALGRKGDPRFESLAEAVEEVQSAAWCGIGLVRLGHHLWRNGF
jgi:hypothetical protein